MYKKLIPVLLLFIATCTYGQSSSPKTILFIGAHPDDETAISEVLNKYALAGHQVQVIIATDGKDGTRVTSIPAGDSLGQLRRKESICGCAILGTAPPIFLGLERLDTKIGVRAYFNMHKRLLDSLRLKIPAIHPDVIITTGPDGDTHHSEHIVVGAAVTELLLSEGWVEKYPLYYFTWKKKEGPSDDLGYVDEQYLNVKISYTEENEKIAIAALHCHVTQFTAEEIIEEAENKRKDKEKAVYFRRFVVLKGMKTDFD